MAKLYSLGTDEFFIGIVADNIKEARAIAWSGSNREYYDDFLSLCREVKLVKNFVVPLTISKGEVDLREGLKYGVYDYVEYDCDDCENERTLTWEFNSALCSDCIEKRSRKYCDFPGSKNE